MAVRTDRVGEFDQNGKIKRDVRVCAVSGKAVEPGDSMISVPGTPYFYRLKAGLAVQLTAEKIEKLEAALGIVRPAPVEFVGNGALELPSLDEVLEAEQQAAPPVVRSKAEKKQEA